MSDTNPKTGGLPFRIANDRIEVAILCLVESALTAGFKFEDVWVLDTKSNNEKPVNCT